MNNSKDEGLITKYLRHRLYRRIVVAVLPIVAAILGAVFLFVAVLSLVGGQSDSNSDSSDGDTYDSALILAAAKAMNADPTDEFVSNLEQVIMNESGGNAVLHKTFRTLIAAVMKLWVSYNTRPAHLQIMR
ncbi:hypothetical protein [Lacticaseibacillus manihotivorans]|uniref:hypothetical protein n=1 Tax=Lacticaseibacillus manihotivorans TaxID=88233 RepID=UPI001FB47ED5|nr:hypothetical protein [Lacticaseibacillus manihotivorans]